VSVTIYDVARHAGVSPRTVSNVINEYPFVAAHTRQKVLDSVQVLGYRPNLTARNLRRGRTGMIALAVPELAVPYFSELSGAVMEEAARRSYTMIIEQTDGDQERERKLLADSEREQLFDGLIFSPLGLGARDLGSASTRRAPVVLLGERVNDGPFDHVTIDNVAASRAVVAHLAGLGRQRIAAIGDQPYETGETAQFRTQGYLEGLETACLPADRRLIIPARRFHREAGAQAMRELLRLRNPPDAVFCYNDLLAAGAIRVLLTAGLRVPQDVAVAGFDDIEEGRYSTPTLTSLAPDKRSIAAMAVEQLFRRLEGGAGDPQVLQAPFSLKARESTLGRATQAGAD
jgi:LacI family transcriptional regulator, repressor for deo operon, udp, cdd, tsx, nupC, and nupG